jgi:hypothetical protein
MYIFTAVKETKHASEIRNHLSTCIHCMETLNHIFECYQKGIQAWEDWPGFPTGLTSPEDLLVPWITHEARNNEDEEFSAETTREKLALPEVQKAIDKLIFRQSKAIELSNVRAPELIMINEFNIIEKCYRNLYQLMGHRSFWWYFSHENDGNLEKLISWWRSALLAAQ